MVLFQDIKFVFVDKFYMVLIIDMIFIYRTKIKMTIVILITQ